MIRYCECCGKELDENNIYGKGRFCNKRCQILAASKLGVEKYKKICLEKRSSNLVEKICPFCGRKFKALKNEKTFCSKECSGKFSGNKSRKISEKQRKKISEGVKKYFNDHPEAREKSYYLMQDLNNKRYGNNDDKPYEKIEKHCKVCGIKISKSNKTMMCRHCLDTTEEGSSIRSRLGKISYLKVLNEGRFVGWKSKNITSYAEKFWIKVLNTNNIQFKKEFSVKKDDSLGCYFLDFLIIKNGVNIDLEIDGKQHLYPDRKIHDESRDKYLSEKGYKIYRILWNEISSDKGKVEMKSKIEKFLSFYNSL